MTSDNTLRQNIKTVAWIFIFLGVCGFIDPASFSCTSDFYTKLAAGFTLSNIPLKLFCLLNIIAGAGLLRLYNFWRLYAIVLLWSLAILSLIDAFMFGFIIRPPDVSGLMLLACLSLTGVIGFAMLWVLHTPRVRAMFTKEAAPYAAAPPTRPSPPTRNQVSPPKQRWTTVSDQSLRRWVKMIGWIMIVVSIGALIGPINFIWDDNFYTSLAKNFSSSGFPLKLFYLLNIIAGAGLLHFRNFWRRCAIVLLWPTAVFLGLAGCFFVYLAPPFFWVTIPAAVIWLSPFAMLRVLYHPRVKAMFTKEAAAGGRQ